MHAHDPACNRQYGWQVGRNTICAIRQADNQPGAFLKGVQFIFPCPADHKGVIACQIFVCQANGLDKIIAAIYITLNRMNASFAIIHGTNCHALFNELLAKFYVVDHIAIMGAHHIAIRIQVWLGIGLRRVAKGCPAQLHNAAAACHLLELEAGGYVINLANILADGDLFAVFV